MFMPQAPLPQKPAPQPPPPHGLGVASTVGLPARAANVEYSVVRWSCPQAGHRTASASALRRTSFSNLLPQSSQEYSKIGITQIYQETGKTDAIPAHRNP